MQLLTVRNMGTRIQKGIQRRMCSDGAYGERNNHPVIRLVQCPLESG